MIELLAMILFCALLLMHLGEGVLCCMKYFETRKSKSFMEYLYVLCGGLVDQYQWGLRC